MRVDHEEELLELESQEPAITTGHGTSYENLPMFQSIWKP